MTIEVALAVAAGPAFGLLSLWLRLRFLRHVYDNGGAKDLRVAADALRGALRDLAQGMGRRIRGQANQPPDEQALP